MLFLRKLIMNNQKILMVILARGGSKGLPGKNIKMFCGKPLIAHTIENAQVAVNENVRLVISTDDKEIAEVARKWGGDVPFMRPKKIAQDSSPSWEAVVHALDWFEKKGEKFDVVTLLEATSPLRKMNHIQEAINLFLQNYHKADALVCMTRIHSDTEHPYGEYCITDGYVRPFLKKRFKFYQRQQFPDAYGIYGGVYISKVNHYRKFKTFYQKRTIPYYLERWQAYEIDDIYDFLCAEAIMKYMLENKRI